MKIEKQALEDRQVELTVEVPRERLEGAMRAAARRLSQQTKIPGFRPGKAPYQIVLSKFGEEAVFEEALETLGQEVYRHALDESEIDPFAPGIMDEIVSRDPLIIRYTVPLAPEVTLGDYRELRIPYETPEIQDDAVEEVMEGLRERQALIEPVDRPAQPGDVVVLDIYGELTSPEEGEDPVLVDAKGVSVLAEEKTTFPIPGVLQYLEGLEAGGEVTFEHIFPDDYESEDLRKRAARFTLKCVEVKSRHMPEWSDDLAKEIGDFEDLADLRQKVRERLEEQAKQETDAAYRDKVIDALVEGSEVSFPPILLEEEIERLVRDVEARLQAQNLALDDYLKIEGKTLEAFREELKPSAIERLKRGLVLGKLVEDEGLEVEDQEVDAQIDRIMGSFEADPRGDLRRVFSSESSRQRIALDLLTEKAIQRLVRIAKGEPEPAQTEPQAETETTAEAQQSEPEEQPKE